MRCLSLIETIPEGLGSEALGWESPQGMQDAVAIPVGDFGFRARLADAMDGGEEEIVGGGGPGAGCGPEGGEGGEGSRAFGGEPEGAGESEGDGGGGEGDGSGRVFDEGGDAFGGAEIGLVDDAGFAVDAGAFDDVVVESVGLLLGDEGGHTG
jgi:hypothetical protein